MTNTLTTWNVEFDNKYINDLHKSFCFTTSQHFVNKNKECMTIIEKMAYDIGRFHLNRLGIECENERYRISFWLKNKSASCLRCVYLHTDIDDYEESIYKNWSIKPLFTSLTYFNENNNPTIITNVTKKESKRHHYPNKQVAFVFPKKNLNVCFESGKYMHGECNLFGNEEHTERLVLVVAVWKDAFPIHVPTYDEILYNYNDFLKRSVPIQYNYFKRDIPFVKLIQTNRKFIFQSPCINDIFFRLLFSDDDNAFKDISTIINTEIIPFVDIMLIEPNTMNTSYPDSNNDFVATEININELPKYMRSPINISTFNISSSLVKENYIDTLLSECLNADINKTAFLLDLNKPNFDFIEKMVYDLAKHDFETSGRTLSPDIKIEYWFKANKTYALNNMHVDSNEISVKTVGLSTHPFLTSITYLNTNLNPTIITNIDETRYKYNKIDNMNLFFSFPSSFKKIQLEGGKYFHTECSIYGDSIDTRNVLVINYWHGSYPADVVDHFCKNMEGGVDAPLYEKDTPILEFIDTKKVLKIYLEKDNHIIDYNFFKTCMYSKNNNNVFSVFTDMFRDKNLEDNTNYLVVVGEKDKNTEKDITKCNIRPFDFFSKTIQPSIFSNKKILPAASHTSVLENIVNIYLQNREDLNEINISGIPELESAVVPLLGTILTKATAYYRLDNMNINVDKITAFDSTIIYTFPNFSNQSFMALLLLNNETSVMFNNIDVYDMVAGNLIYFDSNSELTVQKGEFFLLFYFTL